MGQKQAPIVLVRNGMVWNPKEPREERTNLVIHFLIQTELPSLSHFLCSLIVCDKPVGQCVYQNFMCLLLSSNVTVAVEQKVNQVYLSVERLKNVNFCSVFWDVSSRMLVSYIVNYIIDSWAILISSVCSEFCSECCVVLEGNICHNSTPTLSCDCKRQVICKWSMLLFQWLKDTVGKKTVNTRWHALFLYCWEQLALTPLVDVNSFLFFPSLPCLFLFLNDDHLSKK